MDSSEPALQHLKTATFVFTTDNTFKIIEGNPVVEGEFHFNGNTLVLTRKAGNFNWPMSIEKLDANTLDLNLHVAGFPRAPLHLSRH